MSYFLPLVVARFYRDTDDRRAGVKLSRGQRGPKGRREPGGSRLSTRPCYTKFKEKRPEPGRVSFSLQTPIHSLVLLVVAMESALCISLLWCGWTWLLSRERTRKQGRHCPACGFKEAFILSSVGAQGHC